MFDVESHVTPMFFDALQLNAVKYPNFYIRYVLKSLTNPGTEDGCGAVEIFKYYSQTALNLHDIAALNTIFSKGWGCAVCRASETKGVSYLPMLQVPGAKGPITNTTASTDGSILQRKCVKNTQGQSRRSFHTVIKSGVETKCYDIVSNCAVCDNNNPGQCLMCFDRHSLVEFKDQAG